MLIMPTPNFLRQGESEYSVHCSAISHLNDIVWTMSGSEVLELSCPFHFGLLIDSSYETKFTRLHCSWSNIISYTLLVQSTTILFLWIV